MQCTIYYQQAKFMRYIKPHLLLADYMSENIGIQRSDVLIVPCTDKILMELKEYALKASKEYISIENEGITLLYQKQQKITYTSLVVWSILEGLNFLLS